jgi:hypothetical protein
MEYKTLGIIAIIVFATTSAFMADGDEFIIDTGSEYEYTNEDWSDFDVEEFFDENNLEFVTTSDLVEPTVEPRVVVSRMTCDQINMRISELREDVKSYPELQSELDSMIGRQRTQCATTVNRRPVHNYDNINPIRILDVPESESDVVEQLETESVVETKNIDAELMVDQETENAKITENLAHGLCGDGTKPNRYGCCPGEVFKEVEPLVFGCCPKDGNGQCVEPIK